jgi:cytochrome c oxidase subunit IV
MMRSKEEMRREIWRLALVWGGLVSLGAAEFAASFLPLPRSLRPLLLILAGLMVLLVADGFMEVRKGPSIVRAFAVAALFWLLVLLGLGSVDPLTRTDFPLKELLRTDR